MAKNLTDPQFYALGVLVEESAGSSDYISAAYLKKMGYKPLMYALLETKGLTALLRDAHNNIVGIRPTREGRDTFHAEQQYRESLTASS